MYSLIRHGRWSLELQKWRNLRVSVKLFQNASSLSNSFSSATVADASPQNVRNEKNFTVSYLVDSLGLTRKLAESISRKVSFEEKGNPDSVLNLLSSYGFSGSQISSIIRTNPKLLIADAEKSLGPKLRFLRSNGFTDSQISTIITGYPGLLIADVEKSLGPKLKFLQSRGASTSELTDIVSKVPKILGIKKGNASSRYYDLAKEIIEADKSSKYVKLSHSLPEGCQQENKIRNVLVLRDLGVPQRLLLPLLISDTGPVHGKEKFEESLKKVVEMGFDPTTSKFIEALRIVQCLSEKTIQEKINVFKSLGFGVGDVWEMFKKWPFFLALSEKYMLNSIETLIGLGFSRDEFAMMVKRFPHCIKYSAESVTKKTEFLVKNMNWPLKALVSHPAVFGYSMEKRIVPRCNVIKALISKGLLGSELPPIKSVLSCTDEVFLKRYVRKHDDKELVAELMSIFTGDRVS